MLIDEIQNLKLTAFKFSDEKINFYQIKEMSLLFLKIAMAVILYLCWKMAHVGCALLTNDLILGK